jgi:hypothetical protein
MSQIFQYRLKGLSRSVFVGKHPSQWASHGQLFKRYAPFTANADPRRIDMRASVLDPFEQYQIRTYQQHSLLDVYLIADFSASFRFIGKRSKPQLLQQLLMLIAYSALSVGDYFAFLGCGEQLDTKWFLPANRDIGRVENFKQKLTKLTFSRNCNSLSSCSAYLSKKRSLIFLLSDFHVDLQTLPQLLSPMKQHDVVPLVLWDEQEYQQLPSWGLVTYQDMETFTTRTLFMRPSLNEKIRLAYQQRRMDLQNSFRALGYEPLFLTSEPLIKQLNHYFHQRSV